MFPSLEISFSYFFSTTNELKDLNLQPQRSSTRRLLFAMFILVIIEPSPT